MATARFTFSMDAVQDAAYIRRLELELNLSAAVRAAIMAYYDQPTHAQLDAKLDQVLDALRGVQVVRGTEETDQGAEPARARANLDKLKNRFGGSA